MIFPEGKRKDSLKHLMVISCEKGPGGGEALDDCAGCGSDSSMAVRTSSSSCASSVRWNLRQLRTRSKT
jgi:hypothetical protein